MALRDTETADGQDSDLMIDAEAVRVDGEKATRKAARPDLPGMGDDSARDVLGVSGQRLRAYLERIERLEEEKQGLADDIKDIFAEARAFGFDVKTLHQIVKLRKIDVEKRREADGLLELYKSAIGME